MILSLFDIDGTLLRTQGLGRAAMIEAATVVLGRPDAFDQVSFAGAVDSGAVSAAIQGVGIDPSPEVLGRFRRVYTEALRQGFAASPGRASLCPGARAAVTAMKNQGQVGLLTGNWRIGARIKLGSLDMWRPFEGRPGAFGDDAHLRNDLLPFAVRRARARGHKPRRVLIIGDTPADVECARAGAVAMGRAGPEVVAVAVCTGFSTREALVDSAPDVLIEDLIAGLPQLLALTRG